MTHILIPREPSPALLRPFTNCLQVELPHAWAAMVRIAEVQHARAGSQCLGQIEEPATLAGTTIEQYARMFNAACEALGQISDCLGINSDIDPGAEPIIAAIEQLRAGSTHPVLNDRWKARMLDGRAIERDAQGLGEHPDLPWLDEGMNPPKFFEALGLHLAGVSAQDQLDVDAYDAMAGNYDAKEFNFSAWAPASPEGSGWCLVSIHDTEDGPVAWWLREQPYVAATRPVRRARERDDLTVEECREYLRSGWTRVRGRAEQALMLQLCEALEAGAAPAAVAGPAHWEADDESRPRSRADLARVLDEWNDTTGCIPRMSSWRVEVLSIIEDAFDLGMFLGEKAHLAPALEAPAAPESAPWCPDVCPITGRPFFMWIDHWQTGKPVPTYGGPYDSYTIPVKDSDGSFECERYDHDEGGWLTEGAGWHCLGVKLVNDQSFVIDPSNPRYNEIEAFAAAAPQASAAPADPLCWVFEDELPDSMTTGAYNALYPHSRVDMVRMFPIFGPAAPAAPAVHALSQAAQDVLAERRRQVEAEGYDTEHDDTHVMGEIGALAALYLMPDGARDWDATSTTYGVTLGQALLPEDWTMPKMGENRRRDVVMGIACGLAELERLDRAAAAHKEST